MEKRDLLLNIEQLDEVLRKGNCMIYGAGKVARAVIRFSSCKKYTIESILVSCIRGNPGDIMGIPVYEMEKYQGNLEGKCLIVAAMENLHCELENSIAGYDFEEVFLISDLLFRKVLYDIGDFELDCLNKIEEIRDRGAAQERRLLRFVPRPCLEYIVVNILDHCNLKCKGCDHFACLADPYFVPYDTIYRDLKRLSEIFHGDYIMQIAVMGGEPLLHPDLLKILAATRKFFPYAIIRLTTNGLLLLNQNDEFWHICKENDVTIVNTKYPINLDFDKMREKAANEKVKFQFFEGTGEPLVKKSFKKIINLKGNSDPVESFANCHISNYGNFLMEGKIYSCPFSCQSYRIFNQKFDQKLRMTENDFLDIYKVEDMQEVFDFAARPKYYCRYCVGISARFDWERSKGRIEEWVD